MFPSMTLFSRPAKRLGMRWLALRDMKRRHMFERSEVIRRAYLFVARNETLPDMIRTRAQQAIHRLPRRSTPCEINSVCLKTGKSRAVMSEFKITRYQFKLDVRRGLIPGVHKAAF